MLPAKCAPSDSYVPPPMGAVGDTFEDRGSGVLNYEQVKHNFTTLYNNSAGQLGSIKKTMGHRYFPLEKFFQHRTVSEGVEGYTAFSFMRAELGLMRQ